MPEKINIELNESAEKKLDSLVRYCEGQGCERPSREKVIIALITNTTAQLNLAL